MVVPCDGPEKSGRGARPMGAPSPPRGPRRMEAAAGRADAIRHARECAARAARPPTGPAHPSTAVAPCTACVASRRAGGPGAAPPRFVLRFSAPLRPSHLVVRARPAFPAVPIGYVPGFFLFASPRAEDRDFLQYTCFYQWRRPIFIPAAASTNQECRKMFVGGTPDPRQARRPKGRHLSSAEPCRFVRGGRTFGLFDAAARAGVWRSRLRAAKATQSDPVKLRLTGAGSHAANPFPEAEPRCREAAQRSQLRRDGVRPAAHEPRRGRNDGVCPLGGHVVPPGPASASADGAVGAAAPPREDLRGAPPQEGPEPGGAPLLQ